MNAANQYAMQEPSTTKNQSAVAGEVVWLVAQAVVALLVILAIAYLQVPLEVGVAVDAPYSVAELPLQ